MPPPRMHILHINSEFPPIVGGGSVEAHLLYREIARRHQVTVITPEVAGSPPEETLDGIRVLRCPVMSPWSRPGHVSAASLVTFIPSSWLSAVWNRRALRQVDVINTWFAVPAGVPSPAIGRLLRCPTTLTLCGADVFDPVKRSAPNHNIVTRTVARRVLRAHDAVTAISSDLAFRARRDLAYPDPIEVIPMGIDSAALETVTEFRPHPRPFRLVSVSRLVERKGIAQVVEALGHIKDLDFVFHVVGEGPLRPSLEARVRALGMEGRVIFEGFVSDERAGALLRVADGFVLCSHYEGQCQAILEAAAHGVPVVTGNVGGQTDMIRHRKTGLLVEAGNVAQIAEALRELIMSPELRLALRTEILSVVKRYDVRETAARYLTFFERVMGVARAGRRRQP